ncbi:methyltransferase domain-containing protein [Sorangium sp. So ce269]
MANIVDDMTRRLLSDAGITAGMRVLDVGCGRGDVSLMISRLVGEQGQVLGLDRDVSPVAAARERARELGLSNVAFAEGDLGEPLPEHGLFDAAVGRRVLMYQRDPVVALRGLARAVRPGGLVVFQENDASIGPVSSQPLPLHDRVRGWIWRTVEREGANLHMGFDLASVLERAGLTVEHVRAEAIVQTPRTHFPTGLIVRAMLARIVQQGVASAEEIEVDTLEQRLAEELQQANATYVGEMVFGAWARKPA